MIELIKRYAKDIPSEKESLRYLITAIDYILGQFTYKDVADIVFQEDIVSLEKELAILIDRLAEYLLKENFANLADFVKKNIGENVNDEIRPTMETPFNPSINSQQNDKIDKALIENIYVEFKELWTKKVDSLKDWCSKEFGFGPTFKHIFRKVLMALLSIYTAFSTYVKQNYPGYTHNMIAFHIIMKEIESYKKSVGV